MDSSNNEPLPSHLRPSRSKPASGSGNVSGGSGGGIKNKAPAAVQITAEQLLREAWERKDDGGGLAGNVGPRMRIDDADELREYQRNERKTFEMRIVRNRLHIPLWMRYARWEEEQRDFVRARSVWERAIDTDYRSAAIWIHYAEFEMRHRFINHARNVLDRAVALLPRVDSLWMRYAHMEEMLQRPDLARNVFDRWLKWLPGSHAYFALIRFELRQISSLPSANDQNSSGKSNSKDPFHKARSAYYLLTQAFPTQKSFLKWAKFEERNGQIARARATYEKASVELLKRELTAPFFIAFAKFEERRKQIARARAIYQFAIAAEKKKEKQRTTKHARSRNKRHKLQSSEDSTKDGHGKNEYKDKDKDTDDPSEDRKTDVDVDGLDNEGNTTEAEAEAEAEAQLLDQAYTAFEKQHGDAAALDAMIVNKRRLQLEDVLKDNVYDYDAWFELIQLEERASSPATVIRTTYERAVAQVPAVETKAAWSRYIYLWLLYAAWTEINDGEDENDGDKSNNNEQDPQPNPESQQRLQKAIEIYRRCVATVPYNHARFSFAKLWLQYAHAHVRRGDLAAARQVFGTALGVLPNKHRLYDEYTQLECAVGEIERARDIFRIWLVRHPSYARAFVLLSDLELRLGENARALAVLELGTAAVVSSYSNASLSSHVDADPANNEATNEHRQGQSSLNDEDGSEIVWSKLARTVASICDRDDAIARFESYVEKAETEAVHQVDTAEQNDSEVDEHVHRAWAAYIEMMMAANNDALSDMQFDQSDIRAVFERAFNALRRRSLLARGQAHQQVVLARLLDIGQAWVAWESSLPAHINVDSGHTSTLDQTEGKNRDKDSDKSKDGKQRTRVDDIKERLPQRVSSGARSVLRLPDESSRRGRAAGNRLLAAALKWKSTSNSS